VRPKLFAIDAGGQGWRVGPNTSDTGYSKSPTGPGRNATGFTNFVPTMAAKWLEVLKEIAPRVKRAVLLFNPETAPYVTKYHQRSCSIAATMASVISS
jgi:putative ABC transport system substrate-binding protein